MTPLPMSGASRADSIGPDRLAPGGGSEAAERKSGEERAVCKQLAGRVEPAAYLLSRAGPAAFFPGHPSGALFEESERRPSLSK